MQENYKEVHVKDKTLHSGLWIPLGRESTLEIVQATSTVFARFYFFGRVTVSWQFVLFVMLEIFCILEYFYNEEKRCRLKNTNFQHSLKDDSTHFFLIFSI